MYLECMILLLSWKPTGESSVWWCAVKRRSQLGLKNSHLKNVTRSCSVLSSVENEGGL